MSQWSQKTRKYIICTMMMYGETFYGPHTAQHNTNKFWMKIFWMQEKHQRNEKSRLGFIESVHVGGGRVMRRCWVNFQCRGVLLIWIIVGQGPIALVVGAGGGCLDIFSLIYHFSFLSPSLWETARYRLKYCLKGPLRPKKPTNQLFMCSNIMVQHCPRPLAPATAEL